MKKLNLGCGLTTPAGWINLDGSWNAYFSKYPRVRKLLRALRLIPRSLVEVPWDCNILIHDVRKPLPFPDGSIDAVYSSHLLEHLYLIEAQRLLRECARVLKPAGVLRIVVPDLRSILLEYAERSSTRDPAAVVDGPTLADRVNERLLLRSPNPPHGSIVYRAYSALKDFHSHKWMYDADSLVRQFERAGFVEVRPMDFHVSRIDDIQNIEQPSRVLNGEGICVEGVKNATVSLGSAR